MKFLLSCRRKRPGRASMKRILHGDDLAALFVACTTTPKDEEPSAKVEINLSTDFPVPNSPLTKARIDKRIADLKYQRGVTLISNLERLANSGDVVLREIGTGPRDRRSGSAPR